VAKLTIESAVRLGDQLVRDGVITPEQLAEGLARQSTTGVRIGRSLVDIGALSSSALVQALSTRLSVKGCLLRHGLIDPKVAKLIPKEEAQRMRVLPLFRIRGELTVAMVEPKSLPLQDRLTDLTGCTIRPVLVLEDNLEEFQNKYRAKEVNVDSFLASMEESDIHISEVEAVDEGPVTDLDQMIEGSPIINLVNLAILTALRAGASDIHIEPDRDATHIRYRIDGRLREMLKPPKGMHAAIVSRVKVIGRMDIAEKRLPQEGRVHIVADGREIDLRVSSMPTVLGEKIVLRILDKSNISFELSDLGVRGQDRVAIEAMVNSPYGLMLVTGPTGSGKTTTLYSALDLLRSEATNIVTIEDPVEYQLPLINQIQVNESVGLSFVRALRSILRQDPDVIMVGEIRDRGNSARCHPSGTYGPHGTRHASHERLPGGRDAAGGYGHRTVPDCVIGAGVRGPAAGPQDLRVVQDLLLPTGRFVGTRRLGVTAPMSCFKKARGAGNARTRGSQDAWAFTK